MGREKKYPEIAQKLRQLRATTDYTQDSLALTLGLNPSTYSSWEEGISRPKPEAAKKIADFFRLSPDDIYHPKELVKRTGAGTDDNEFVDLPVMNAEAGSADNVSDVSAEKRRVPKHLFEDAEGILIVYGNSMSPSLPPGCELAVSQCRLHDIEYGVVYAIQLKGASLPIVKRIFPSTKGESYLQLYSDNIMTFGEGPKKGEFCFPLQDVPIDRIDKVFEILVDYKRRRNKAIMLRERRENQYQQ